MTRLGLQILTIENPQSHQRARGALSLRAAYADGVTRVKNLGQHSPCRIFFPTPATPSLLQSVLVNTSGGLVEGDELDYDIALDQDARLAVDSQAAEKVYRSLGQETRVTTKLTLGANVSLFWTPQETILFNGARFSRRLTVALEANATFFARETVIFGRRACGETFNCGAFIDEWRIVSKNRLIWFDALRYDARAHAKKTRRFAFADSAGLSSIVYCGAHAERLADYARDRAMALGGGATCVNGVLFVRFLDPDEARLRANAERCAEDLRARIAQLHGWESV